MSAVMVLGTGQVGVFAARAIAAKGRTVVAADRDPAPGFFARFGPRTRQTLIAADVLIEGSIAELAREYDVEVLVMTFGLGATASAEHPELAHRLNVEAPVAVARSVIGSGVRRVIFLSSFAVYGRPAVERLSEAGCTAPASPYGRMKLQAETALLALRAEGLDVRVLRPCGVYGPLRYDQGSQSAQLIESLLIAGVRGRELRLKASGASADEYIYVKDLAEAITVTALAPDPIPYPVFNVGSGEKVNKDVLLAALYRAVPNIRLTIEPVEAEQERIIPPLDISRIREVLGFSPAFDLAAGLQDYIREAGLL